MILRSYLLEIFCVYLKNVTILMNYEHLTNLEYKIFDFNFQVHQRPSRRNHERHDQVHIRGWESSPKEVQIY